MLPPSRLFPRYRRTAALAAVLAATTTVALGAAGPAGAQEAPQQGSAAQAAAVMSLEGDLDQEVARTLSAVLRNEAEQNERFRLVNAVALGLGDIMTLVGCSERDVACLDRVAEQLEADVLLFGEATRIEGGRLRFVLESFDRSKGQVTHRMVREFEPEDDLDLVASLREEIEDFFLALQGRAVVPEESGSPATLRVSSSVEGATVVIDGRPAGSLPYVDEDLAPGRHTVEVRREGFLPWRAVVELEPGGELRLQAPLQVAAVEVPSPAQGPRPLPELRTGAQRSPADSVGSVNWPAWGVVSLGALALGGSGFSALQMLQIQDTLEEKYQAGTLTRDEREELVGEGQGYETAHQGLLAAGCLLVGIGAVWLVVDALSDGSGGDDGQRAALTVGVGIEPAGLVVTFP